MVVALQILLLAVLTAVSVTMLVTMARVVQGAAKRRLLAEAENAFGDNSDGIGISLLYSGLGDMETVSGLLDVSYGRYELVLVIDARQHAGEFAALALHYGLMGVCHTLDEELPTEGVRGLYRSRKRCFRRLVVVDKAFTTVADDLTAAAGVATYDYVLPMRDGWRMMPNAIGRLAAELSDYPDGEFGMVYSLMGVPAKLISRQAVIVAGGFAHSPWRSVPRRRRRLIYEPLMRSERPLMRVGRGWSLLWGLLLAAAIVAAAAVGWWLLCAVLLCLGICWGAVCVSAPLVTKDTGFAIDAPAAVEFLLRKYNLKSFTLS